MLTLDQIAAQLQGYDPQALKASDVNEFLSRMVVPVHQTERVSVFEALGRVLAQDLISPINVPPHDNSAMDGFAFYWDQVHASEPVTLRVVGTAFAGAAWKGIVEPGECLRVMTGAILPTGLDTVVPQEMVQIANQTSGQTITIPTGILSAGDNRRLKGEDIRVGSAALL